MTDYDLANVPAAREGTGGLLVPGGVTRLRVGLDIDDVLFPWGEHAHAWCEAAGVTNGASGATGWAFYEDYGIDRDTWWSIVEDGYRAGLLLRPPYPYVRDVLTAIHAEGHTIHLCTARGFGGTTSLLTREHTALWLAMWQIPHDSLTFVKDKRVLSVDAFLDDRVSTVVDLHDHGVLSVAHRQPHNARDLAELAGVVPVVDTLTEFARDHLHIPTPGLERWL